MGGRPFFREQVVPGVGLELVLLTALIEKRAQSTRHSYPPNKQNARGHPRALGCPRVKREMLEQLYHDRDNIGMSPFGCRRIANLDSRALPVPPPIATERFFTPHAPSCCNDLDIR